MSSKKILFVSYHYPPENVPASYRASWYSRYLPEFGWEPSVLCASDTMFWTGPEHNPDPIALRRPELPWQRNLLRKLNRVEAIASYKIWAGEYGHAWTPFAKRAAKRLDLKQFDAVHSVSLPIGSQLVARWIKRRYPGVTWYADFMDPYAANPSMERPPWLQSQAEGLERSIFTAADRVMCCTEATERLWRERYPALAGKIHNFWAGFDPLEPMAPQALPPRAHQVMAHLGAVYGTRRPGALLTSFRRLIESGRVSPARVRMLFMGPFDYSCVDEQDLGRLREVGALDVINEYRPRAEALRVAAESDFLLILDVISSRTAVQVPSKLYDNVRIGRPILMLTMRDSPSEAILARSGIAYACIYPDMAPADMDDRVAAFLALPTVPRPMSDWFASHMSVREVTRKLVQTLEQDRERKGTRDCGGK